MENKDLYIRLLEYGNKNSSGFKFDEIIDSKTLKLKEWERVIIEKYLNYAYTNCQMAGKLNQTSIETPFLVIQPGDNSKTSKYVINFDYRGKYIDYLELKEARENSKQANKNANFAIKIEMSFKFKIIDKTEILNSG